MNTGFLVKQLACIVFLILASSKLATAQEHPGDLPTGTIERSLTGGNFKAKVSLGALPAGKHATRKFRLQNATDTEIKLATVTTSCSCASLKVPTKPLAPGQTTDIEIVVIVPSDATTATQRFQAILKPESGKAAVLVECHYTISGLLAFGQQRFIGEFNLKNKTPPKPMRIPIIATAPLNIKKISTKGIGALSSAHCEIIVENETAFVVCQLAQESLSKNGLAGEIEIRDSVSGIARRLPCLISAKGEYEIAPAHLSLTWDDKEECYYGRAIFRLTGNEANAKSEGKLQASLMNLNCRYTVDETPVGKNQSLYRLFVSIFPSQKKPFFADDAPTQATWKFLINGKSFSEPVNFTFYPTRQIEENKR